ncbi:efflux RND transporter periplasmic adaptor subunit [Tenacibaculum halocynthiae]|uniref:efflux RND transporter periplasmic adaptor subunit n=1 Tax=Tenacibaculum halocynthiae TaxID=1254437 RepID=UPI003D65A8F9
MKIIYKITLISIFLLLFSCGKKETKTYINNNPKIAVKVSKVITNNNSLFITASGKIQAVNNADLSTRIMGFVNKTHVNIGDKVKKGQLLISINNADLQAKNAQVNAGVTEAKVAFNNAKKDYTRFKNLLTKNSASQKEMDDMTARFKMAKARLESANQMKNEVSSQFKYTNLTAPFNGVITAKNIKPGDMATPGKPLISIENHDIFEVITMVPENEISKIQKNIEVNVLIKSINKTIKGKVTEISHSAKNTGGQYIVKIRLNKTNTNVLSGMFTAVQFPITKKTTTSDIILIPKKAIITRGQLSGIYTVSQSKTAILRWLRLGRSFGENVEVLSGLSANESYIVSSEGKLYNGVSVLIK